MASSTPPEPRRPSIITKRTHLRNQKHENNKSTSTKQSTTPPTSQNHHTAPRIFDSLLAGLGYASLTYYVLRNWHKHTLTTYELATLSLSTFTIGYGLFDLGKRMGMIAGSSSMLREDDEVVADKGGEKEAEEEKEEDDEEDEEAWKGQFKGREFEELDDKEKIEWLRLEGEKIRGVQGEEELRCGRAYIAKEQAYVEYEKFGGYGGSAWKRYADADVECQTMYNEHQKQQKRLKQIGTEINELQQSI